MSYKEADIMHECGEFWVMRDKPKKSYAVMRSGFTHSVSLCGFALTDEGLSLAIAYCNYKAMGSVR